MQSNFLSKLIPFLGYASMAVAFAWALFDPGFATVFLLPSGFMIFVLEFISIHSIPFTLMVTKGLGGAKKVPGIIGLYAFYSVFVAGFGAAVGNLLSLPFFWFTSAMKIIDQRNRVESEIMSGKYAFSVIAFILLIGGAAILFSGNCPLGQGAKEVKLFSSSSGQVSGLFADCPQILAVWGTIYFLLMAITELLPESAFKKFKPRQAKTR
ncbi:MAG: hypothetical protein Q8N60_04960 [Candidatus Diapherotrites archaeon]|nr:hypothetical protein [Candidatus Diapherotrites archaeon]